MSWNIHSLQDCLILQEDLDSLGLWEADWQMKFNVAKSLYESVSALLTQTLENVHSAKYLGITNTENMDWGQHITIFRPKQLRLKVSFEGTWLSHLGVLRWLHTKLW